MTIRELCEVALKSAHLEGHVFSGHLERHLVAVHTLDRRSKRLSFAAHTGFQAHHAFEVSGRNLGPFGPRRLEFQAVFAGNRVEAVKLRFGGAARLRQIRHGHGLLV